MTVATKLEEMTRTFSSTIESYKQAMIAKKQAEMEMVELKLILVAYADGQNVVKNGLSITDEPKKGNIDYKVIPAIKAMTEEELDFYRKKPKPENWVVRATLEKNS